MEIDPVTLRPAAKMRSEHTAGASRVDCGNKHNISSSSQARARPPTASPAINSENPPANPYQRPGRRIVVNELANTIYTPEQKAWDGWDSDLDRASDVDQEGDYRKGLKKNLHRSEEYKMESLENTLTIIGEDPIMQAQAVEESRRLARLASDRLGEYAPEGYGRIGDNTEDWLSPPNTSAVAMGDQLAPFDTSDTSLGSSKEEDLETEYRQPFAEVVDHPLVPTWSSKSIVLSWCFQQH